MLGIARTQKVQLSTTEDGQRALALVLAKVDSKVRQTYNNELWSFVMVYSDIHGILNPGSNKFNVERVRSIAELKRPRVPPGAVGARDRRRGRPGRDPAGFRHDLPALRLGSSGARRAASGSPPRRRAGLCRATAAAPLAMLCCPQIAALLRDRGPAQAPFGWRACDPSRCMNIRATPSSTRR